MSTRLVDSAEARTALALAVTEARRSLCLRSRCGAVIISSTGALIGRGYNSPPLDCPIALCRKDSLPASFRSDRTCCLHAEQRAVFDALARHSGELAGSTLYFIRLDAAGNPEPAGDPYCTICSKTALDVGIGTFVLWHERGPVAYGTQEYNELSFAHRPKGSQA